MAQGFNGDVKSLMTFNKPATGHEGIVHIQETDTKITYDLHKRHRSGTGSILYPAKTCYSSIFPVCNHFMVCRKKTI